MIILTHVADQCGYESVMAMLEAATFDVCPGVCMGCKTVVDSVEPDTRDNCCEECHAAGLGWDLCRTVKSVLVIAELV
jgi:hypothetical protein